MSRPVRKANFFDSSWIWTASSRVGARTRARRATTWLRPPPYLPPLGDEPSSLYRMGSMKARVLPEPVCATEITSSPLIATGTELPCTGVGTLKPANRRLRAITFPMLSPANSVAGRMLSGSSLKCRGSSTSTGMSAYLLKSMPDECGAPNWRKKASSSSLRFASKSGPPSSPTQPRPPPPRLETPKPPRSRPGPPPRSL